MNSKPHRPQSVALGAVLLLGADAATTNRWVAITTDGNSNKEPEWMPITKDDNSPALMKQLAPVKSAYTAVHAEAWRKVAAVQDPD